MSFLGFLVLGLIAGAIAKMILPGRQGGGWLGSLICGVLGALLGGWLGAMIFGIDFINQGLTSFQAWITAIIGALLVLVIWGFISSKVLKKA